MKKNNELNCIKEVLDGFSYKFEDYSKGQLCNALHEINKIIKNG